VIAQVQDIRHVTGHAERGNPMFIREIIENISDGSLTAQQMKISDLTISDAGMAIAQSAGGGSRTDAPLTVTKLPSGHVYLVNGYHRLIDAMKSGKDTVAVKYVPYKKVEILWKQEREDDIKYGKQFNEEGPSVMSSQQMLTKLSKEMQGTHTGVMDPNSDWSKFVLSHKGFTLKDIQVDQIPTAVKSDGMSQANIEKYKKADTSQFPPMVIGNDGYLLDGNHRLQAYKAQGIKTVKAYIGEEVEVSLHGDAKKGYVLSKIEVSGDERNAGQGTKAMQDIVDRMDREGAIIALTPDDAFGGNKNRLIKFYKRFGFVPNKGRNKDFRFRETMIRYPQSNESVNEAVNGLPVKTLTDLFHVGTLDASKKRDGYEGAGLSVSTHPDAWQKIARGHVTGDTHTATKEGNKFLDVHSLSNKHNEQIKQWAVKNGYLEQQETVTVSWFDDEMDDTLSQTFNSMADAEAEYDEELEYMDVKVDKGGIVPTDKLKKETRQNRIESTGVLEFVLPIFAEHQGLDGVWWQDKLDVQRYSAPRGVIVPSKIKSWKFAVNENFKDGKVKGKSRPGRVKRSGASCNGSVTELRAKAKKASGEKAKMYHWCANMRSGKKK